MCLSQCTVCTSKQYLKQRENNGNSQQVRLNNATEARAGFRLLSPPSPSDLFPFKLKNIMSITDDCVMSTVGRLNAGELISLLCLSSSCTMPSHLPWLAKSFTTSHRFPKPLLLPPHLTEKQRIPTS